MSALKKWFPLLGTVVALAAACAWIFQLRLGGGDLYPEYSSLRADALGTRALHDALAAIPSMEVNRDYRPLAKLGARPQLVLLPGLIWRQWRTLPANQLAALNAAAGGGGRIVLAFRADQLREDRDKTGRMQEEEKGKQDEKEKVGSEKKQPKPKGRAPDGLELKELAKAWGITLKQRWLMDAEPGAERQEDAPADLPRTLSWRSDLYFSIAPDAGWRVIYRRAGEPVLVEKDLGRGTVVLLADAYGLSNESVHRDRATPLLSWLVGGFTRVTFVESTLGVLEENGIGFLARRYGLGGALALCALLGALYAWSRLVAFVPPRQSGAPDGAEVLAGEPAAGITTLLRRSLGPAEVLPACVEEWRKGLRPGGNSAAAARLDAAWRARDPKKSLSTHYNALARALKPR